MAKPRIVIQITNKGIRRRLPNKPARTLIVQKPVIGSPILRIGIGKIPRGDLPKPISEATFRKVRKELLHSLVIEAGRQGMKNAMMRKETPVVARRNRKIVGTKKASSQITIPVRIYVPINQKAVIEELMKFSKRSDQIYYARQLKRVFRLSDYIKGITGKYAAGTFKNPKHMLYLRGIQDAIKILNQNQYILHNPEYLAIILSKIPSVTLAKLMLNRLQTPSRHLNERAMEMLHSSPVIELNRQRESIESWAGKHPFIVAYRVHKENREVAVFDIYPSKQSVKRQQEKGKRKEPLDFEDFGFENSISYPKEDIPF